jgi:hypothetical protein
VPDCASQASTCTLSPRQNMLHPGFNRRDRNKLRCWRSKESTRQKCKQSNMFTCASNSFSAREFLQAVMKNSHLALLREIQYL